ncbi:MAG TPA: sugar kinase [Actinopolymorphaceae bacterium]
MTVDLVTLGETMGLVAASGTGPFRVGSGATISFGGAETNVAIGVSRLGHRAAWFGRLGSDPLGDLILDGLRGEGVSVDRVRRETEVPTGLMLREHRTADRVRVSYYRRDLAGSRLAPDDLDLDVLTRARVLHVSGITPALSGTAKAAVHKAVTAAREAGVLVSFDLNYRAALWSAEDAGREFATLVEHSDIVFAGLEEAELVTGPARRSGRADEDAARQAVAEDLASRGPSDVVVKLGVDGALAIVDGEVVRSPGRKVESVDPVGAGDAFVAGYLSGLLDGDPPSRRLARGNVCGAFAVSVAGDWEGLPRRSELTMLDGTENVTR